MNSVAARMSIGDGNTGTMTLSARRNSAVNSLPRTAAGVS